MVSRKLRLEADCCATLSIIYARPDTSLHVTEPQITLQDLVTIISGTIEAWVGLSAAHAFLFLEELYDILVEAKLMRPLPSYKQMGVRLKSILTNLSGSAKSYIGASKWTRSISQLFTYLPFHQIIGLASSWVVGPIRSRFKSSN